MTWALQKEAQQSEMRSRMQQAELEARRAVQAEAKREEESWLERFTERLEQETLAECYSAEEESKRHEVHMEAYLLEERARLAARDEACTEAWLVYAWAEAEARVNEEAAAMREEVFLQEELAAHQAVTSKAAREDAQKRLTSE